MSKLLSQKCTYAVKAVFDLAREAGSEITKIATIAERQEIPARFLEGILRELRQGGFVESRRGADGGYRLAQAPAALRVGEIIRFIEGDLSPAPSSSGREGDVFDDLWREAQAALWQVFDGVSFQDLLDRDDIRGRLWSGDYVI
jgi:Rrf2 family transcriptional regulator, cysteine metabolism repressor